MQQDPCLLFHDSSCKWHHSPSQPARQKLSLVQLLKCPGRSRDRPRLSPCIPRPTHHTCMQRARHPVPTCSGYLPVAAPHTHTEIAPDIWSLCASCPVLLGAVLYPAANPAMSES